MKIYRIELYSKDGVSLGFLYASSRKKAVASMTAWKRANRGITKLYQIEVNPTRDGIIKALINYGGHPDNG